MQQDIFIGDKKRINEVLVNILGNAVKYTPEGGMITFTISEAKVGRGNLWEIKFSVKDNGIGMSEEGDVIRIETKEEGGYLYDVVGDDFKDASLRPNQILSVRALHCQHQGSTAPYRWF